MENFTLNLQLYVHNIINMNKPNDQSAIKQGIGL